MTNSLIRSTFALSALGLGISAASFTLHSQASAAEISLQIELPRVKQAAYHRPYVAVWLEKIDQPNDLVNLALWFQQPSSKASAEEQKNPKGAKWLPDLRQWWRKSGRSLSLPLDGISGASKAAGVHPLHFDTEKHLALKNLSAGSYQIVVEAAREAGGRELLRLPIQLAANQTESQTVSVQGEHELGKIQVNVKP